MDKEKLRVIYARLSAEIDRLHDQFEDLKVEPDVHPLDRRRLTRKRSDVGMRDYTVSNLFTSEYLLYEISKLLAERRGWHEKIAWLSDTKAHDRLYATLEHEFFKV